MPESFFKRAQLAHARTSELAFKAAEDLAEVAQVIRSTSALQPVSDDKWIAYGVALSRAKNVASHAEEAGRWAWPGREEWTDEKRHEVRARAFASQAEYSLQCARREFDGKKEEWELTDLS